MPQKALAAAIENAWLADRLLLLALLVSLLLPVAILLLAILIALAVGLLALLIYRCIAPTD